MSTFTLSPDRSPRRLRLPPEQQQTLLSLLVAATKYHAESTNERERTRLNTLGMAIGSVLDDEGLRAQHADCLRWCENELGRYCEEDENPDRQQARSEAVAGLIPHLRGPLDQIFQILHPDIRTGLLIAAITC